MDCHDPLNLTSLSLYLFVNVLYVRTLFLLQNTFCHAWSRLVRFCRELHYILVYDLYTVSVTLFDATLHNLTFFQVR
jgi:hypothetical protein